jgi:hypothetical protein
LAGTADDVPDVPGVVVGVGVGVADAVVDVAEGVDEADVGVGVGVGVGVSVGVCVVLGVCLCLCPGVPEAVIVAGTVGMMPVRFSVAVGKPSVAPVGLERVIVAVRVSAKAAAALRGTEKVAKACPGAKLRVP